MNVRPLRLLQENAKYLTLFLAIICIYFKKPALIVQPRIWAEEGSLYFQNAYNYTSYVDFFSQHMGYYSLLNKVVCYLGLLFPLAYFPWLTLFVCVLVYVGVIFVIFFSLPQFSYLTRLIVWLLLLISVTGEAWLNVITLQFWLCASSLFILFDSSVWDRRKIFVYYIMLCLTFTTGPFGVVLAPLFLCRYLKLDRLSNAGMSSTLVVFLAILTLVQMTYFLFSGNSSIDSGSIAQGGFRFDNLNLISMVKGFVGYYVTYPFISNTLYEENAHLFMALSGVISFSLMLLSIYSFRINAGRYFLFVYLYLSLVTIVLSVSGAGGLRYSFASSVCLFIWLVHLYVLTENIGIKFIICTLLATSFLFGICYQDGKFNDYFSSDWPVWSDEVTSKSCAIQSCVIDVWPQNPIRWKVNLNSPH